MAAANQLPLAIERALQNGFFEVPDPGASGTISWTSQGVAICRVKTAAAESRALYDANAYAVGQQLLVVFQEDGGDLTLTGAKNGDVVLNTAGDVAHFVVTQVVSGGTTTRHWVLVSNPPGQRNRLSVDDTTGDIRNSYIRISFESDGAVGGEAVRSFTNVNANIGTAHGAHISLSYAATAGGSETSGLGAALRGTLHIPNVASWAPTGSIYAGFLEIYSDGSDSDPNGLTELAVLALSNSGDGTGKADVDTDAAILALNGWTAASGTTNVRSSTALTELTTGTIGFRVLVDGASYYLPLVPAAEWN